MAESERRYVADRIAGDTPAVLDTLYDPAPVVATYRNDDHARAVADNLNLRAEVERLRDDIAARDAVIVAYMGRYGRLDRG